MHLHVSGKPSAASHIYMYMLITILGFSHPSDGINTEDKITLCIVENYLDFKVTH